MQRGSVIGGISSNSNSPNLCLAELTVVLPKCFADVLLIIKPVCCLYAQLCIFFSFVLALRVPWRLILS